MYAYTYNDMVWEIKQDLIYTMFIDLEDPILLRGQSVPDWSIAIIQNPNPNPAEFGIDEPAVDEPLSNVYGNAKT